MHTFAGWIVGLATYSVVGNIVLKSATPEWRFPLMLLSIVASIAAGAATTYTLRSRKESAEKRAAKRLADETERLELETREANEYSIPELEAAFERAQATAKRVDGAFLNDVVITALSGRNVGRNEFERRDFAQDRDRRVREIKATPLLIEPRLLDFLGDYDFERKRFPLGLSLLGGITVLPRTAAGTPRDRIDGFIPMEAEQARSFRLSEPKIGTVRIVCRPESVGRDKLYVELLGLQLLDTKGRRLLC